MSKLHGRSAYNHTVAYHKSFDVVRIVDMEKSIDVPDEFWKTINPSYMTISEVEKAYKKWLVNTEIEKGAT